ncbi:hypothetical protein J7J90_01390 [Candidatus Micrarchaeota archaeon]|nr:hypothetical protein [Candidatus Micrarchaeota archaeon]
MDNYGAIENFNSMLLNVMEPIKKGSKIEIIIRPIRNKETLSYLQFYGDPSVDLMKLIYLDIEIRKGGKPIAMSGIMARDFLKFCKQFNLPITEPLIVNLVQKGGYFDIIVKKTKDYNTIQKYLMAIRNKTDYANIPKKGVKFITFNQYNIAKEIQLH